MEYWRLIFKEISVNTLYLGLLISTYFSATGQVPSRMCVNALYLGLLISTLFELAFESSRKGVNALYLGLLIST